MANFLSKIFGSPHARFARTLQPIVDQINALEASVEKLSSEELRDTTKRLKERIAAGEDLDELLPEAFAVVREAANRVLHQRHFDVQLIGGIALHQGKIAEMKTGEGKTLVATLPLYLNSLLGKGAHLVTPNDYLSRVGAGWMGPVYHALGVSTGIVAHDFSGIYDPEFNDPQNHADTRLNHFRPVTRHEAYAADITYGTNNEFGFDYLRDNLEHDAKELRQKNHQFAIVDEVDSILIDEARTPLIISVPDEEAPQTYQLFARLLPQLKENIDYNIDEKLKAATLTEDGVTKVEKLLGIDNIYEEKGYRYVRYLESALRAHTLFRLDKDYVVKNGEVIIVDEFTGRLMPGRRWSEGLHQAVEAKEGVQIQRESRTLATITFQNYFRMYKKLAGMTGTADTSAEEFHKVYNLDVAVIPTHRLSIRDDKGDLIFRTEKGKFQAVVREIKERHQKGQPVLIGTVSIEKSEKLARMLSVEGVRHEVLNAKNHEREALIIAQAGRKGAVTVATNMAGRGVDILLGGSPPNGKEVEEIRGLGGLHVIGTERHEARRIDNQLRGRAGRQGDPGSSRFFVSLEDDLMRVFGSDKIKRMMETFGIPEDESIENKMVSRALESAQAKIEGFHFDTRKYVLEFDDVLNKQRDFVYRMRKDILAPNSLDDIKQKVWEMVEDGVRRIVGAHTMAHASEWNLDEIAENVRAIAGAGEEIRAEIGKIMESAEDSEIAKTNIIEYILEILRAKHKEREDAMGADAMRSAERMLLLRTIDSLWMDHLDQMEHLRDSVRLRAYGQRDPLVEYKREGNILFKNLQATIGAQVAQYIFKIGLEEKTHTHTHAVPAIALSSQHGTKEINRNDPCPCGAKKADGKSVKYKHCHGKNV